MWNFCVFTVFEFLSHLPRNSRAFRGRKFRFSVFSVFCGLKLLKACLKAPALTGYVGDRARIYDSCACEYVGKRWYQGYWGQPQANALSIGEGASKYISFHQQGSKGSEMACENGVRAFCDLQPIINIMSHQEDDSRMSMSDPWQVWFWDAGEGPRPT